MGLDITVYKLYKSRPKESQILYLSKESVDILSDKGFGHFIQRKKQEYYNIQKWFKEHKLNQKEWSNIGSSYGWDPESQKELWEWIWTFQNDKGDIIHIYEHDCSLLTKIATVFYVKEVGYQRKGLNSQFYDDYRSGLIGYYVTSLAELENYKQNYCATVEDKQDFQRNIIDKFIEGKTIVTFDW